MFFNILKKSIGLSWDGFQAGSYGLVPRFLDPCKASFLGHLEPRNAVGLMGCTFHESICAEILLTSGSEVYYYYYFLTERGNANRKSHSIV